jgi:hypothetical protein
MVATSARALVKNAVRGLLSPAGWATLHARWWQLKEAAALDHSAIRWPWFRRAVSPDSRQSCDHALRQDWRRIRTLEARAVLLGLSVGWPITAMWQTAQALRQSGRWVAARSGVGLTRQGLQILRLALRYNCPPASYFKFRLFEAADPGAESFSYVHHYQICNLLGRLNEGAPVECLNDKVRFSLAAAAKGLSAAVAIAVFRHGRLEAWHSARPHLPLRDLVLKACDLSCGSWFERWDYACDGTWTHDGRAHDEAALLERARERSTDHGVFLQERLTNHPTLAALSGQGLSTVRLVTGRDESGAVAPLMASFRMACGSSTVDNFAAGGIAAPVDLVSGTLGVAVAKRPSRGEFTHHPDSGARIAGVGLPGWTASLELVTRAHRELASIPFVGWDVVLSPHGPLLLEANTTWCVDLLQIPNRRPLGPLLFPRFAVELTKHATGSAKLAPLPS